LGAAKAHKTDQDTASAQSYIRIQRSRCRILVNECYCKHAAESLCGWLVGWLAAPHYLSPLEVGCGVQVYPIGRDAAAILHNTTNKLPNENDALLYGDIPGDNDELMRKQTKLFYSETTPRVLLSGMAWNKASL
jgi:hypothetical protein